MQFVAWSSAESYHFDVGIVRAATLAESRAEFLQEKTGAHETVALGNALVICALEGVTQQTESNANLFDATNR
jgi:hypothetical protein